MKNLWIYFTAGITHPVYLGKIDFKRLQGSPHHREGMVLFLWPLNLLRNTIYWTWLLLFPINFKFVSLQCDSGIRCILKPLRKNVSFQLQPVCADSVCHHSNHCCQLVYKANWTHTVLHTWVTSLNDRYLRVSWPRRPFLFSSPLPAEMPSLRDSTSLPWTWGPRDLCVETNKDIEAIKLI